MSPQVVIAAYRPREGQDAALRALISRHVPALREAGLATARPVLLLRSLTDGTYLEIFEWASADAARQAHEHPVVRKLWEEFDGMSEFRSLGSLPEAGKPFPHFEAVDGVTR